ncbi:MAG: 4-hydroxy-tetrahydrodipicolinate reductase [Bacteroidia bacterium]|nr:4-hydroxy-tetrahydrodipicolinate reductase [Bacteroidia bacterium]MBT8269878.1 4-hydroxy-tetrahydrodipicolinate reductase [Bacteroidia bacterium]NNF81582.1 4-hydroxy-tetrahydrodipicolinate reductase [Flavobacteriaceae bacterium]NNK69644.1 4-hydroxy-tetrahydrodipicolinate reductase [Flavobacteriaceae bacterium]NNL81459.1 4-hydroxy-tetrahydrodipicolinate reductase [Flavobacteriaceae bacterium]
MKIALFGYGKMGKTVEKIAVDRGHEIVLKVEKNSKPYSLNDVDVAIDFSTPDAAFENISNCLKYGIPVISGTTGWLKDYDSIASLCKERDGAFIYASNFSLGVNIFFEINRKLAAIMSNQDQYKVKLEEVHHTEKLDAPSGTAISLAEGIISESKYASWDLDSASTDDSIPIKALREKGVTGTHIVQYSSDMDRLSLHHEAFNRKGFAMGAVIAAEWLKGKTGIFSMRDVLNIG